jgi:hypothetical protein
LRSFTGRAVVVRVTDIADVAAAAAGVRDSGNELFCVIVETSLPLSEIEFHEDQLSIPLAVMTPSMGSFRALARNLDALRRSAIRVYLPCNNPDNLAALRILSSLGIHVCAQFVTSANDWEALTDLMTYAVLGRSPHASIEPFSFIAANYNPHSNLPWGLIEFDDPSRFLHLDEEGRVALSCDELKRGVFVAQSVDEVGSPAIASAISEWENRWRRFFTDNHPCASCAGWKVCVGRFSDELPADRGCARLFTELIEVATMLKSSTSHRDEGGIWRP